MTKIEAYKAVVDGQVTEDVLEKFREMIEAHETETEKRRERAAEKRAEKLEGEKALEDGILAVLGEEPMTASDIAEAVEGIKTPQKATVVVKRLVAAGLAHVQDVKGKKGKVKGYTLAQAQPKLQLVKVTYTYYLYVIRIRKTGLLTRFFYLLYILIIYFFIY